MKVECIHGYFKFTETEAGQLSRFVSLYDLEIERVGDYYTFTDLIEAPNYSLAGGTFLGTPTTETFEGEPWEVMRANRLVYDFVHGIVVPIDLIFQAVQISTSGNYFVTTGMIQPGSVTADGSRVTDYAAFYIPSRSNFQYSEINYE